MMGFNKKKCKLNWVLLIIVIAIVATSCDHNRNKATYDYFPDMKYSDAYETYAPNPNFKNGATAQAPIPGTVSRENQPYPYPKTEEGRELAAKELINPFEVNEENLSRGKDIYNIYCGLCHGDDGKGEGRIHKSGKYPSQPSTLVSEDTVVVPDGAIYHVITVGSAIMQAHASQIRSEDRWKSIMYIKEVLQKEEWLRVAALAKSQADTLNIENNE